MTVLEVNEINELCEADQAADPAELGTLAYCLKSYIEQYGDQNQSFDILRALANLTIERIEQGRSPTQITAGNILAAARISIPDGKSAGTRLSPVWNKLIDNLQSTREQGIQDFARNQGLKCYPWPEKDKSEGGRPSQYYLKGYPLPENKTYTAHALEPGEIAYIRELTPAPSWWVKPLLNNGYRLEGWRRWLFLTYGLGSILFGAVALILLWALLWRLPTWPMKEFSIVVLASVFFIFSFWTGLKPFFRLLEWRIVMAPTSLVALNETNVQMEIVRDSQLTTKSPGTIRLVRYASTCPQCNAKIEVDDGRKEFPDRLVGRCRENPAEHVYSFDRFSCKGRSLR